jgi:branched-chain amino acid transport system permease protein
MVRQLVVAAAIIAVWAFLPRLLPRHMVDLLVFSGIYAIAGLGVGLLLGQCGIVNLAQAVFYAIGAYASANLTAVLKWPSFTGFVAGAVLSAGAALLVGYPILRLRGYFLALATLALSLISVVLFLEWGGLTGAALGMGGIPPLNIGGWAFNSPLRFYYLVWAAAIGCFALAHNLTHSRTGLMLQAMRDSEPAAESLAIRPLALRTRMFVLCSLFGSLAGSLFAHYAGYISFQSFTVDKSIDFLLIPVLGGSRSVPGVALGALFITFAPELLDKFGGVHQILFGLLLVIIVVLLPGGLISLPRTAMRWLDRGVTPLAHSRARRG